jgi:uroporphyrinogen-III decarboxylase
MFLILHCDGYVGEFIPLLIEAGFDCIQPLEARAGNDVRDFKSAFDSNIVFFGNINADVLANGTKDDIEEEVVTKVETAKAGGGYIYHIDHSVPPTVSFENYCFARKLVKEHGTY